VVETDLTSNNGCGFGVLVVETTSVIGVMGLAAGEGGEHLHDRSLR
jgi:hypothetical protein